VRRHGALVLGVCHHVLHHRQDAEDAFQATFLVLARKAASIRNSGSVGSWLYGVAYRLARKAQAQAGKRPLPAGAPPAADGAAAPLDDLTWREVREVLHEEVARLPERYRAALLLCYWQGKTQDEAARELGCKKGTLKEWLERARKLLRSRLVRRGIALTAALPAAVLTQSPAAAVPPLLVAGTAQAATLFAAGRAAVAEGVSAKAAALAETVLKGTLLSPMRILMLLVVAGGLVVSGAVGLAFQGLAAKQPPNGQRERPRAGAPDPGPAPLSGLGDRHRQAAAPVSGVPFLAQHRRVSGRQDRGEWPGRSHRAAGSELGPNHSPAQGTEGRIRSPNSLRFLAGRQDPGLGCGELGEAGSLVGRGHRQGNRPDSVAAQHPH
jgi:RNA polymerase sigma factor (sigma-70 family)